MEALGAHVRAEIARVLGAEPHEVGFRRPLSDLGLDSLSGLELRNRQEASLGVLLSPTLVWSHPTLHALVPVLAEMMGLTDAGPEDPERDASSALRDAMRGQLDPLTTDEVAESLAEELRSLESRGS
jgi:hypothetical protein